MYALAMDTENRVANAWGGAGTGWRGAMGGEKRDVNNNLNNKENKQTNCPCRKSWT